MLVGCLLGGYHTCQGADGDKRTGFVLGILFLELNGYRFTAYEEDAARAVFDLAAGSLAHADYTSFVRANCTPE